MAFVTLFLLASPHRAEAVTILADLTGGISQFRNNEPFFGPGSDNPSGLGYALNLGAYICFSGGGAMEFQLGFQEKLNLGSQGAVSYSLFSLYPTARFQFSRIYFSGGITPWIYRGTGLGDLSQVGGALGYHGEVGFLLPVTPRFSFMLAGSAEWVKVDSVSGPGPVFQVLGGFRVYWGVGATSGGGSVTSNEFKGWRYPFGWSK
ncbi:MAG TPA: hypothetical protein VM598_11705 [Bdellovibrionota bacterium]|nr:hypothetical protein [Bdellovibrionota bacterium]